MSDISRMGVGVLIGMLSGAGETSEAVKSSIGKTISSIEKRGDELVLSFDDGKKLVLWDGGQSCCENRYMVCDDKLAEFAGAKFLSAGIKEAPQVPCEDVHEVQFLEIETDRGAITCANHNEHNGWYGGFSINARIE